MRFGIWWTVFGLIMLAASTLMAPSLATAATNKSGGLVTSIAGISVDGRVVSVQFSVSNTTQRRQYFYIITGSDANAALGSGIVMPIDGTRTAGAKFCGNNFSVCNQKYSNDDLKDYNNLSYLEPGDSTIVTLNYVASENIGKGETTVTLQLIFAVRTASATSSADVVEQEPGPLHVVRFNLPRVPLPPH